MFNSTILDVAIGMIFVYLLLSLICSAAHELVEYWLKKRASDLERGIRELLTTEDGSDPGDLVSKLYNHGLVSGLFQGTYEASGIQSRLRHLWGTKLPSYIPSRNFALSLMDLILPATQNSASGAAGATPPPPPNVQLTEQPDPPPPPGDPGNPLSQLRNAVNSSPVLANNARVKTALTSLIDAAESDVSKARENIETWFNSGMDRVSGWYKRRTQITIFAIGLIVTVAVNADSIRIAKKLSTDRSLRESLVAAADAYAKANATASSTPASKPSESPRPNESPTPKASHSPAASPAESPASAPSATAASALTFALSQSTAPASSPTPNESPSPSPIPTPCGDKECKEKGEDSPQCKLAKSQCAIKELGLPIGWSLAEDKWPGLAHIFEGSFWSWCWEQLQNHGFGWLLTALAISLGAPFWFDMLNKFIVVRSTVKPKEKSPEEKSKD